MSRILITGCSKGLGRATALELARRGHEVIATARKVETLADLPVAAGLPLDVTSEASVRLAVEQAGQVDVLVNNASTNQFRWRAGADAEKLLAARAKLDDDAFDAALRSALRLD
jgi:NAD(P)-dependent dehydrogenase (short-subunit alcohol dehydrogenase family)